MLQLLLVSCPVLMTCADRRVAYHKGLIQELLTCFPFFKHQPCSVCTANIGTPNWQHNQDIPFDSARCNVNSSSYASALEHLLDIALYRSNGNDCSQRPSNFNE